MGNRGILHDDQRQLGAARWRHKAWVTCVLEFKGRKRPLMAPGAYTELFFHDEAVALAAGHRPCAECRRADHLAFRAAFGAASAPELDAVLHKARVTPRTRAQIAHTDPATTLPDGAFFHWQGQPHLCHQGAAHPFAPGGYGPAKALPDVPVQVLTPAPTLAALRQGYVPMIRL